MMWQATRRAALLSTCLWVLCVPGRAQAGAFCPQVSATISTGGGTRPNDAQCGDFDGNGLVDIVTANDSNDSVSFLMAIDGTSYAAASVVGVGNEPLAPAIGDIDGNGTLDVVTANHSSNDISVLINDGNGNFTLQPAIPTGLAPYSIALAKLNADNALDIITANAGGNSVSVHLGVGDGTFESATEYPAGDTPNAICAVDLDGDTFPDLVSSNIGSSDVSIFWNHGDGTFDDAVNVPLGVSPFDIACCDLDGDGRLDIVGVDGIANTIGILFNLGGRSFSAPAVRSGGSGAFSVACHDMDGDNRPDVMMANLVSDDVTLFENIGGGELAANPVSIPIGQNPSGVTVCLLNQDNEPDLAVPFRSGVKTVLNSCVPMCATADAPTAVPNVVLPSRYLAIVPGNSGTEVALRVRVVNAPGSPGDNGVERWVGAPEVVPDPVSNDPGRTFLASRLSCEPYFRDWSTVDALYVYGGEITPGTVVDVEALSTACADLIDDPSSYSTPLSITTAVWGDAAAPFAYEGSGAAQPDFTDISTIVEAFLGDAASPGKPAAQLQPNTVNPQFPVDFRDIAAAVTSFLGSQYPYVGSCVCPSAVPCGVTACTQDSQCADGLCVDGFCRDACGRCTP